MSVPIWCVTSTHAVPEPLTTSLPAPTPASNEPGCAVSTYALRWCEPSPTTLMLVCGIA